MSNSKPAALVSVICRSVNRTQLGEALQSIARQTYPKIEIVLVDAGGKGLTSYARHCGDRDVKFLTKDELLNRPRAANFGLENCSGEYLMFLDEDDWIAPNHIANLVECLQQNTQFKVAYSSTQKTDQQGRPNDEQFVSDFDQIQLNIGNYIPIHAALFEKTLLQSGCHFDESLAIYEDWDFWLQLSQLTDFIHLDKLTAFYRAGGDSETALAEKKLRFAKDHPNAQAREKVIAKWQLQWSAADINQMLGRMDSSAEISELQVSNKELRKLSSIAQQQLKSAHEEIHSRQQKLEEINQSLEKQNAELTNLTLAHRQLEQGVTAILNSFSWRITKPYRYIKHRLDLTLLPAMGKLKKPIVAFIVSRPGLHNALLRNQDTTAKAKDSQLIFAIDSPNADNCIFVESLELQGWAAEKSSEILVTVFIDELEYRSIRPGLSRIDLAQHYPEFTNIANCGFDEKLSLDMLSHGKHQLKFLFTNKAGLRQEHKQAFYRFNDNDLYNAWLQSAIPTKSAINATDNTAVETCILNIIFLCSGNEEGDKASIQSLQDQHFTDWHCYCVGENSARLLDIFCLDKQSDACQFRSAANLNTAYSEVLSHSPSRLKGSFFLCLEGGERLRPHALQELLTLASETEADLVYSDHDKLDNSGVHFEPWFTFGWSPDHLLSRNYIGGVFLAATGLLAAALYIPENRPAWRYKLLLKIAAKATTVERVAKVLWSSPYEPFTAESQLYTDEAQVVLEQLEGQGLAVRVETQGGDRTVDWPLEGKPKVSIIIPTMGKLDLIQPCLESLVDKTVYDNFEVVMLDNSRGKFPQGIEFLKNSGFKVIECNEPFNWSRLNNIGAQHATGEFLLFLNDDIEITDGLWLEKLVKQASRKDVGTVGARLLYPNGALQHAGVLLVNHGGGGMHLFHKMLPTDKLFQRLHTIVREVSANTGACLMTSREKFDEINGFDEELSVVGNDLDLCFRLMEKGYRNIWTPECTLIHHESISRESTVPAENEATMWRKWGHLFSSGDRYYNPNLSLRRVDCKFEVNLPVEQLKKYLPAVDEDEPAIESVAKPRPGVNLIGYIRAEMGLGEGARSDARALNAVDEDFGIINFETANPARMTNLSWKHKEILNAPYDINLIHINAGFIATVRQELPTHFFNGRYNIAYWAWELPEIPADWLPAFALVDEVWVPSNFVREAVEKKSTVPVITIPHCVDLKKIDNVNRGKFHIPANSFAFLSMFDTHSIAQRKNPYGAIEAFKKAFDGTEENCCLLLKVNNGDAQSIDSIKRNTIGYSNIIILEEDFSRQEIDMLLNAIDCYVSLHRAEGFGLPPAEAMCLGKTTILTNWSGNTDYMDAQNCLPIDYELVKIEEDFGPYKAGQFWAEPDIDQAAAAMRRLIDEPGLAERIGARAKESIENNFSPLAVGKLMQTRLQKIRQQLSSKLSANRDKNLITRQADVSASANEN